MRKLKFLLALYCLLTTTLLYAQPSAQTVNQWEDQKFSMFIHFGGIYSVLGGVWDGKPVTRGLSEQIQAHAGIYSDVYAAVANNFTAKKFNADSIVLLAKAAGMRSIVLTSKHHDGFCMFKTATTDYNVVDATPFGRDVVKEFSEACKRHGLRFGLYFSLIDWHYPQASPISSHNSDPITPEHHEYNKKQVTELLTNYGPISEIWFDMGSQTPQQSQEVYQLVHRLQPQCMVSSRLGNDQGDFTVMADNTYPDYAIGLPWQTPASFFNETWSYRSWQIRGSEDVKYKEKLESLIGVVSGGGNYLLNIGPEGDGSVVPFEKDVLLKIGNWLHKNGEAIYGTRANPFYSFFKWGNVTSKSDKIYLIVTNPPADGVITLPGLNGKIESVKVLGEDSHVTYKQSANHDVAISLPQNFDPNGEIKVIALSLPAGYAILPAHVIKGSPKNIRLNNTNAYNYYSASGIDYGTYFRSTIKQSWTIATDKKGEFKPVLTYTEEEKGREIDLDIIGKTQTVRLDSGIETPLKNDLSSIQWGPVYLSGKTPGILGSTWSGPKDIDISKPLGRDTANRWHENADATAGKRIELMGNGVYMAYYATQNIIAPKATYVLLKVTSGDGVQVYLNGKLVFIHNNPDKLPAMEDVVGLNLQPGNNQLLVQVYNSFKKKIPFAIDHNIPQVTYQKALQPVTLQAKHLYPVSWKLHNPANPHQTINVPNLELGFVEGS
jgi:alpha-L-fucosidase